ncbi:F0F1 ATP synthase subunit epsilon [Candidatus Methylobacter oryzae]|uniref:ATP synthase epsilon chain n=1 Tax=Candidatus Methylobacter oryzae TaxID=2497749 RepID=A0ABY3CGS0_9GAMM|nr:F0F1 ATP synthase subunit epsilon [Candidatus Methylobacter oryzae]TRX03018.1 F0F1 ATP synthase subunit epsilon [Candidatus Methylobacter oryzae]
MNRFVLNLFDASHERRINGVTSFVGEDASGSFGIKAHHARFMTTLVFGLARFRLDSDDWQYLALPGAVAYFNNNELTISTRHFLVDTDLERISTLLEEQLIAEEENLRATRESLHRMEQAMIKRMLTLKRKTGWQL